MAKYALFGLMMMFGSGLLNAEPLRISAGIIPNVFHPQTSGPYNRIFDMLFAYADQSVRYEYYPLNRAIQRLSSGDYDCFAPALKNSPNLAKHGIDASTLLFVGPVSTLNIKVYVKSGTKLGNTAGLAGKLVTADATIVNLRDQFMDVSARVRLVATNSYVEALAHVVEGRAAAALAYDVDVAMLPKNEPVVLGTQDTGIVLASYEDGMVCKDTAAMRPVVERLQKRLGELRATGAIDGMLTGQ